MNTAAAFSVGTSSNALTATGISVDMSLDDIIKARRQEKEPANKPANKQTKAADSKTKRTNIKTQTTNQIKQNKPNNAQKSIGANKAKRNAQMAAKRGMPSSGNGKASPMDVEREVYRQSRGGGQKTGNDTATPRRSGRILGHKKNKGNGSNKTVADQKVKKRNIVQHKKQVQQKQGNNNKEEVVAPTRKAIGAAKQALSHAGYKPPKGMKMVVSFVAADGNNKGNTNNKSGGKQNGNGNQNQ